MRLVLLTFALLLVSPFCASAQNFSAINDSLAPQNKLVVDPTHPQPGDVVTVSVDDYSGGTFGSKITWRYSGNDVPNSLNQRSIRVIAGSLGSSGVVEATMTLPQGGTQVLQTTLNPVYLDVIVEPQTRTPNWYLGRGMPSIGSLINVTALVNDGTLRNPSELVYTWQVNRNVLDAGPVRGRNKMTFATPRGDSFLLSVSVSEASGKIIASKIMRVNSVMPSLAFYEQHPLYGSRQIPIKNNQTVTGNNITLTAEPYNLDGRVYNNPDVASWEIDAFETDNGKRNPYQITLQQGVSSGQTTINFHVRSLQEVLQGSEESIRLTF